MIKTSNASQPPGLNRKAEHLFIICITDCGVNDLTVMADMASIFTGNDPGIEAKNN